MDSSSASLKSYQFFNKIPLSQALPLNNFSVRPIETRRAGSKRVESDTIRVGCDTTRRALSEQARNDRKQRLCSNRFRQNIALMTLYPSLLRPINLTAKQVIPWDRMYCNSESQYVL